MKSAATKVKKGMPPKIGITLDEDVYRKIEAIREAWVSSDAHVCKFIIMNGIESLYQKTVVEKRTP